MSPTTTSAQVAEWMLNELERQRCIYQDVVVHDIVQRFGEDCTYINKNGNRAIRKDILDAFRKISGNAVVWESGSRLWRKREQHDSPGRQQS
jgi:hypothetical protein